MLEVSALTSSAPGGGILPGSVLDQEGREYLRGHLRVGPPPWYGQVSAGRLAKDAISGEPNFDIDRDSIVPGQPKFDLEEFKPTKVLAFERELDEGESATSETSFSSASATE